MMIWQGKRGRAQMHIPVRWGAQPGSRARFVTGTHLSYPAGPGKAVVREPAEEVKAAGVASAATGLLFLTVVPLDESGMRRLVPCRKKGPCEGAG